MWRHISECESFIFVYLLNVPNLIGLSLCFYSVSVRESHGTSLACVPHLALVVMIARFSSSPFYRPMIFAAS